MWSFFALDESFRRCTIRLMQAIQSLPRLLVRLWKHISSRRRMQYGLLVVLMVLASFAEVISIGAVLPFLGVLTAPDRVFNDPVAHKLIQALGVTEPSELLFPLTVVFCVSAVFAGAFRLLLLWANTRISFATGADLGISIYRRTLYQPYLVHVARNSSEVISGITSKASNVIYMIVMPLLTLISACIMLLAILVALLSVDPLIAIFAFGSFGLIYGIIARATRRQLRRDSDSISREGVQVIKCLQEGLGGIRDVLIDGSQATYCESYRKADLRLRHAQGNSSFISASPRYVMESLGMLLIAALAYALARQADGIAKAIPILGALALGAQRMLPVLQQAYSSWSTIQAGRTSLFDTLELLDQPMPDHLNQTPTQALPFNDRIKLRHISFRYNKQMPWVLSDLNLVIRKGSRVGFIGATGSGKSTMLDVVMGLLQPTAGEMEVDGHLVTTANNQAWQAHIAHVPQTIFLADSSIEENIAFGVPKEQIDANRVRQSARQAQIANVIEAWPEGYRTFVGERGVRLSGGQRQRIGIARALYKKADVIVFDEATSALDNETEQAVMEAIDSLSRDLTLLIVAHRVSTLKNCTQIVELSNGGIKRSGSFHEIVNQAS